MVRRHVLPTTAFLIAFAVLCSLGTWQVQRLAWKEALIERVETRASLAPVALEPPGAWTEDAFASEREYRPTSVTGSFREAGAGAPPFTRYYVYTLLSQPRGSVGGQGYFVHHAFDLETGGTVYLNRGFVPPEQLGAEDPPPAGTVTLSGLLREPKSGSAFTPDCEIAREICFTANAAFASGQAGLDVAPFYLDLDAAATPPGGLPQAGETRMTLSNNHLQYAVTWFGLALAAAGVFFAFMRSRLREERSGATGGTRQP